MNTFGLVFTGTDDEFVRLQTEQSDTKVFINHRNWFSFGSILNY